MRDFSRLIILKIMKDFFMSGKFAAGVLAFAMIFFIAGAFCYPNQTIAVISSVLLGVGTLLIALWFGKNMKSVLSGTALSALLSILAGVLFGVMRHNGVLPEEFSKWTIFYWPTLGLCFSGVILIGVTIMCREVFNRKNESLAHRIACFLGGAGIVCVGILIIFLSYKRVG